MLLIVAANLLDLATFLMAASVLPIQGEANPLARYAYINFGPAGVVVLKAAAVLMVAVVLAQVSPSVWKTAAIALLIALPLLGAATNVYAYLRS